MVLTLLKETDIALKLEDTASPANRIDYFGHVIRHDWIEVTNHTADAIRKRNVPIRVTEIC